MFWGSITAVITPFKNNQIDEKAYQSFIDWQINQGTHGLVPCGTTGESPTLTGDEFKRVVTLCVEAAKGRVPVIAGTGSNSTDVTIEKTKYAKQAGATAALVVTPYYNKPTQEGMYQHFKAINDAVDLPIIIYNIPGRSVVDMSVATMARLAKLPNIVGVKDSTADLYRPLATRTQIGADFCQLSGEDGTAAGFLAQGGVGVISVVSNIAPKLNSEMQVAWKNKDLETFAKRRDQLAELAQVLFCETNPAPVKYAASLLGHCAPDVRLPLVQLSDESKQKVQTAMNNAGLLNKKAA
jgi:4-hydroxy-tetrahydrodipicolinate synthase